MTEQQTLAEFLEKRLREDELWAQLASQPPTDIDPAPKNGVHWEWVLGDGTPLEIPKPTSKRADGMLTEHGTLAWLATVEKFHHGEEDEPAIAGYSEGIHDMEGPTAAHIVQHDPARVLREVAAKRAILEHLLQWPHHVNYEDADWGNSCAKVVDPASRCDCDVEELVNIGIRHLAAVYSDHPEYREEWKP